MACFFIAARFNMESNQSVIKAIDNQNAGGLGMSWRLVTEIFEFCNAASNAVYFQTIYSQATIT